MIKNTNSNGKILAFWNSIFSNFYPSRFTFKGMEFKTSEAAFMWCKARHFGDVTASLKILDAETPKEAKQIGRSVKGFKNEIWDKVKYGYMVEVLVAKFSQNENLKKQLLSTENLVMVEGSPYDKIYGVGIHWQDSNIFDESKWNGENLLGKALMDVREILKGP